MIDNDARDLKAAQDRLMFCQARWAAAHSQWEEASNCLQETLRGAQTAFSEFFDADDELRKAFAALETVRRKASENHQTG